jgi:5-methylcytosine-specific restriction endonuclease McrA
MVREPDRETKFQLWRRCDAHCEACGVALIDGAQQVHHRKKRSRGGGNGYSNLMVTCVVCNMQKIEHEVAWATRFGYLVASHQDPEKIPVYYRGLFWVLLNSDGSLTYHPNGGVMTTIDTF